MKELKVNSKKELFEYLNHHISNTYKQLLENKKLDYESSILKTYLIEQDIPDKSNIEFHLKNNFILKDSATEIEPIIKRTRDDELFNISYKLSNNDYLNCYLDISDARIWNLYTLGKSIYADKLSARISQSTFFDNLWLYHNFLNSLKELGSIRGYNLNFDFKKFNSDEDLSPVLKMRLSGVKQTEKVFDHLSDITELKTNISISRIKIKSFQEDDYSKFIIDDIRYDGKISARGTEINNHLTNLISIKRKYKLDLKNIEENYRFGWKNANGKISLEGFPIYFIFNNYSPENCIDVDLVCSKLFDGTAPFKLFGVPRDIKGGKQIQVYDLHIGGIFNIQVYPDMFVLYIDEEVCGNTILRFYTNLQHFFSNNFKIVNDNDEPII
jgi:hypothetical protein